MQHEERVAIAKKCIVGGPVTAVSFLSTEECLYGIGPYLHRVPLNLDRRDTVGRQRQTTERLLLFPDGGTIHGIRVYHPEHHFSADLNDSTTKEDEDEEEDDHDQPSLLVAIFGGRKIAFVEVVNSSNRDDDDNGDDNDDHDATHNTTATCMTVMALESSTSPLTSIQATTTSSTGTPRFNPYMEWNDWIWDCAFWMSTSGTNHSLRLVVGLAHNRVHVYDVQRDPSPLVTNGRIRSVLRLRGTGPSSSHHVLDHVSHHVSHQEGTTRCLTYCMNLWCAVRPTTNTTTSSFPPRVAVGTTTNTIHIWQLDEGRTTPSNSCPTSGWSGVGSDGCDGSRPRPEDVLTGHGGVIHAVKFHPSGQRLASTSDDRTVRLWGQQQQKQEQIGANCKGSETISNRKDVWTLLWTAFGHTARGWDVAFGLLCPSLSTIASPLDTTTVRGDNKVNDSDYIVVSTGEDGTLRLWASDTGAALAVARGHSSQCIWRVDTLLITGTHTHTHTHTHTTVNASTAATVEESSTLPPYLVKQEQSCWAVSGGNDGTVAFYNVSNRIPRGIRKQAEKESTSVQPDDTSFLPIQGSWRYTVTVPGDRLLRSEAEISIVDSTLLCEPTDEPPLKEDSRQAQVVPQPKKAKMIQQTIAGMKFSSLVYTDTLTAGPSLLIATRTGSVWCLDIHNGTWIAMDSWTPVLLNPPTILDAGETTVGCCMCLHDRLPLLAVGTMRGDVVLSKLRPCNGDMSRPGRSHVMIGARQHRSVQKLEWVRPDVLVSFHVQSVVWRVFPCFTTLDQPPSNQEPSYEHTSVVLTTGVKGLVICCAFNEASSKLAVGDTRGNVALFDLLDDDKDTEPEIAPTTVLRNVHQKEHVTALVWKTEKSLLSVGNDGHVSELIVDNCGRLVKLLSVPVGAFTGISYLWNIPNAPLAHYNNTTTVAGGYYGNQFAVVDVSSGYEFFSVDTGGRQRAIDVYAGADRCFAKTSLVAICQTRKDGQNDILLCGQGSLDRTIKSEAPAMYSTGIASHGESVFDVNLFPLDTVGRSVALLTASEDCSAKIALFQDGILQASKSLPPQISGIRSVCSCRLDAESTVVVIGEKSGVKLFRVSNLDIHATFHDLDVRFLGNGTQPNKSSIDHRINCVGCVNLSASRTDEDDTRGNELLVVSGDSNGNCYLYRFSEESQYDSSCGQLLYQDDRPILSLSLVHVSHRYLLVLGGTGGSVLLFDLPDSTRSNAWLNLAHFPLLSYNAHSMGTNALASLVITPSADSHHDSVLVRVCSGGDDQAICCCDIVMTAQVAESSSAPTLPEQRLVGSIHRTRWAKEASMSAVKGLAFVDHDGTHVVLTGYDQRLSLWCCDGDIALTWLTDAAVDIGDVNCLAVHLCPHDTGTGTRNKTQVLVAVGGAGIELVSIDV